MSYYISLDTECFGLFPFHGDHPHTVSVCTDDLKVTVFEATKINDYTRAATWSKTTIKEINSRIARADRVICHNLKYDVLMGDNIGVNMLDYIHAKPADALHFFEDTGPLSHIIYNDEPHGLKELAWKYLGISMLDEFLLHEAVNQTHALRRAWDTATAKGKAPKKNALHIKYQPHHLECEPDQSSNGADFHIARHHPTLGKACPDYAGKDALRTMLLWQSYQAALEDDLADRKEAIQRIYLREKRLIQSLIRRAGNPIHLRKKSLVSLIRKADNTVCELEEDLLNLCQKYVPETTNPNSDTQLRTVLFDTLKLPIQRVTAKSEQASTDKSSLKSLLTHLTNLPKNKLTTKNKDAIQIVQKSLELSKVNTINGYNKNYRHFALEWNSSEPYVLFNINTQGTKFTRGSSSKPNLQNVGGKDKDKSFSEFMEQFGASELYGTSLRSSFGPPKGKVWFSADYSQIELQVFAWACRSKRLKELLDNADVHDTVERELFGTSGPNRTLAKIVSFSLIYGKQENNFDAMLYEGAYKKYTTELFPEAGPFIEETTARVERDGYIETASGYRLYVDKQRAYSGVNAICQGTAGDIIKLAMVGIDLYLQQRLELADFEPILQIHDELVFLSDKPCKDVHKILYTVRRIMERSAIHYGIPCKTDLEIIRVSWDAPEKYNFSLTTKEITAADRMAESIIKLVT